MFQQLDRLTPSSARWLVNFPRNSLLRLLVGWFVGEGLSDGPQVSPPACQSVSIF